MDYKAIASSAIKNNKEELIALSQEIWNNPELNFKEYKAAAAITGFLESKGFKLTRGYCELETAFKAEYGERREGVGASVCVICEYDALPGIGHACGHNLIAESGVAAGLGIQAAIDAGLPGHVIVMGTPAEEGGGGKVIMIERGAFDDIDIAMMVHPAPYTSIYNQYLSISRLQATFTGKAAHAAAFPWEGVNALDAAVSAYTAVSVARQQFKPSWRVHGVFSEGGVKPNIIPERAVLDYYIRAPTRKELAQLKEKIIACFESAAKATGCSVTVERLERDYDNVLTNTVIADTFVKNLTSLGITDIKPSGPAGSTDMGNVTHVVPGMHPKYGIGNGEVNHSAGFTSVCKESSSHDKTLIMSEGMAYTCIDFIMNKELMKEAKEEFQRDKDNK